MLINSNIRINIEEKEGIINRRLNATAFEAGKAETCERREGTWLMQRSFFPSLALFLISPLPNIVPVFKKGKKEETRTNQPDIDPRGNSGADYKVVILQAPWKQCSD